MLYHQTQRLANQDRRCQLPFARKTNSSGALSGTVREDGAAALAGEKVRLLPPLFIILILMDALSFN